MNCIEWTTTIKRYRDENEIDLHENELVPVMRRNHFYYKSCGMLRAPKNKRTEKLQT